MLEAELRTYKKKTDNEIALWQTEANEARMIQTAMQRRVEKLRAEKKVLVAELRALKVISSLLYTALAAASLMNCVTRWW